VSDIDTAAADSLKVLDPKWPIREADVRTRTRNDAVDPQRTFATVNYRIAKDSFAERGVMECLGSRLIK